MTTTLLPEKHVRTGESLIGLGAVVLTSLAQKPKNLDSLWDDIKDSEAVRHRIHGTVTLDKIVLATVFLFSVGAVTLGEEGLLEDASS